MPKENIKFLDYLDTVEYDFSNSGDFNSVVDLTKSVIIKNKSDIIEYLKYNILDGERPDQVSLKLYEDPRYYWLLFLFNDNLREGLNNWPLSSGQFDKMISNEYSRYCFISPEPIDESKPNNYHFPLLPFDKKYFNDIEVWTKDFFDEYVKTNLKIHVYDNARFGIILEKDLENPEKNYINTLGIGDKDVFDPLEEGARRTLYFRAKDTSLGNDWLDEINAAQYPTITEETENTLVPIYYNVLFSHEFLENTPYLYFKTLNGKDILKNHFDVIYDALIKKPEELESQSELTFVEYERIINDRKKFIKIPKRKYVDKIIQQYKDLLNK